MRRLSTLVIFGMVLLSACDQAQPESTPTSTPTPTPSPTNTPLPTPTFTATIEPTPTPTKTPRPPKPTAVPTKKPGLDFLLPTGKPETEWHGIPIMPGAIAGEGDDEGYRFTVEAERAEIEDFYNREMEKLGWVLFAVGTSDAGEGMFFMYQKDEEMASVFIIPDTGVEGVLLVLIVY
jgi:hypothetical protein